MDIFKKIGKLAGRLVIGTGAGYGIAETAQAYDNQPDELVSLISALIGAILALIHHFRKEKE